MATLLARGEHRQEQLIQWYEILIIRTLVLTDPRSWNVHQVTICEDPISQWSGNETNTDHPERSDHEISIRAN
jgi:hypothetical protein